MVSVVLPTRKKRLGREFDHSPPSRAEVKYEWSHTSTCRNGVHSNNVAVTCTLWLFSVIRGKLCLNERAVKMELARTCVQDYISFPKIFLSVIVRVGILL
jgi:hypothetical protein